MKHPTPIDMFTPDQACTELGVAADVLLSMINAGQLAAYNFEGAIRIKVVDIQVVASQLAAA